MKIKRVFHKLFADYFLLNMILIVNLIHFGIMIVYTIWNRSDYRYFTVHFNTPGGLWDLLKFTALFLLPSVLAVISALVYRQVDKKPKFWRGLARAVSAIAILAAGIVSLVLTFIFEPSMPFASFTRKEENIFQYDTMVLQSLPSTNCPDLTREIPEHAENVEFSYWYIDIMDYEWKISVSYTLPQGEYEELRDDQLLLLENLDGMQVTEEDGAVIWDSGDYREDLGRAYTWLTFGYDDAECRIDYAIRCFRYEGY